jgi:hypothetical protein
MTKPTIEPTDLSNRHDSATPHLNGDEPKAPPVSPEGQLHAFRDLARRIYTDQSVKRFETALHALLLPVKKAPRDGAATAQPPTHNPES